MAEEFFKMSSEGDAAANWQLIRETVGGLFSDSVELSQRLTKILDTPSGADENVERRALWHSLMLDYDCEALVRTPEVGLHTQQKDPERAGRLLGCATLYRFNVPFDEPTRRVLSGGSRTALLTMWHFQPNFTDQPNLEWRQWWHRWLMQSPELSIGDARRPAAALELAVTGLATTISELTGWKP